MIGKLTSDKKAHWEQHLPELVQAYNSTRSVVTSYSLHYLMFGRCPHLPIDFYFLTMGAHVHTCRVPMYEAEVREHFKEAYTEANSQTNNEAEWQKQYYDRATSTVQLIPDDIVLMKLDVFQGKFKVKDWWNETEYEVVHQVAEDIPTYEVCDEGRTVHCNWLFLVATPRGDVTSLGGNESTSDEGAAQSTLVEHTSLEWESEESEGTFDEALTQCLASCALLGWVDGILRPLPMVVP